MESHKPNWKALLRRNGQAVFWLIFLVALIVLVIVKTYFLFEVYFK